MENSPSACLSCSRARKVTEKLDATRKMSEELRLTANARNRTDDKTKLMAEQ